MKVSNYYVVWKHRTPGVSGKLAANSPKIVDHGGTSCFIKNDENETVASAELNVYYKDKFCKETGRFVSMIEAIKSSEEFINEDIPVFIHAYKNRK